METLVERIEVSEAARERTKVILLTLGGQWSVQAGFERLGVSRTRFQELRRRLLDGAARAVEERPAGRPRRARRMDPAYVEAMRAGIDSLKYEIRSLQAQLAIARSDAADAVEARLAQKAGR